VIEQLNQLPYSRFVAVEEFISFFQRSELLLQLQLYLGHFLDVMACAPAPHSFQSTILFQPHLFSIFVNGLPRFLDSYEIAIYRRSLLDAYSIHEFIPTAFRQASAATRSRLATGCVLFSAVLSRFQWVD
jgi:hypothetical protein